MILALAVPTAEHGSVSIFCTFKIVIWPTLLGVMGYKKTRFSRREVSKVLRGKYPLTQKYKK
jgi:hypothetical protein